MVDEKMKLDGKTKYAQSSDIKSRTYLEYRKDMKKKAIAELEVLEWLEKKVKKLYPDNQIKVYKSGGDKFLWFLRKGGVSREPDFIAEIDGKKIEFEFQYAEKADLEYYDFKVSKVAKKKSGRRLPIENKFFIYIHKPLLKYAIFKPEWIVKSGEYGMVPAWRSYAFRVPKTQFEKLLKKIKGFSSKDGSYKSSLKESPLDETRYALFSINLLEDLMQDMIYYYSIPDIKPIKKIYENVKNFERTYKLIKEAEK